MREQYIVRFPDGLRSRIKAAAKANRRSMNSEIILVLEEKFPASQPGSGGGGIAVESSPATKTHAAGCTAGSFING